MATIKVIDTHNVCPVLADRAVIKNVQAGSKVSVNGRVFTTKADKKGDLSPYMLYLTEAHLYSESVRGACKASPVEIEFEVVE